MLVGIDAESVGVLPQAVADRLRGVDGASVQDVRTVAELGGVVVGSEDVAASGDAVIGAGGVLDARAACVVAAFPHP
ncbi:hypothetical protein [Streptomyces sp. NBC_01803]|uniref:hypothetical protein n=1 Tax=Streptomyces sp. NBC_01803 TaxID=2975946 RepID=UPI002DDAF5FB|nr:hypothetical protein [Streptomyces sp. NBC_01803]WSA43671.1 hypothetical protein OIE51_05295 [Streptomyces sp. NBC_01803]